ncbi:osmotically inducible protein OsmC [Bacillaceae bacterium SAOS 7]|nr:osmotically inducible protein OsmC [Bacillaceae bacterium SAOS 7]
MNNISLEVLQQTAMGIQNDPSLGMTKWSAQVNWKDGVQNDLSIRNFPTLTTDEPAPLGGTDKGPNPIEYLIGAAASCFAITFEVMATQKGMTLKQVEVTIEANLNAAVFLGIEEGDGGILNPIIHLNVDTDGTKEQIQEIAEIALTKSPVLASLKKDIQLNITN